MRVTNDDADTLERMWLEACGEWRYAVYERDQALARVSELEDTIRKALSYYRTTHIRAALKKVALPDPPARGEG